MYLAMQQNEFVGLVCCFEELELEMKGRNS